MSRTIALLNGPNLGRLGRREPATYGSRTLAEVESQCSALAAELGFKLVAVHSNHEGDLIDAVERWADEGIAGLVVNAGALTHTSVALRDALSASGLAFVEVHISNVHAREGFRQHSFLSDIATGVIVGCGALGYELAVRVLAARQPDLLA